MELYGNASSAEREKPSQQGLGQSWSGCCESVVVVVVAAVVA